ncbi:SHOCT domain-containing protein [Moorella naiadis]|uniref:SHOCT domain-containing protein n=1 Tax=Moorella naiadis (nom. illeg.) TaxID=3093670 RepID=UPI003D9CAF95
MMWGYYNWGMGLGMLLWWVLLLGIFVLAVYGLVSLFNHRGGQQTLRHPDPVEIIKERYAKGEITTEEYHRMREELKG